MHSIAKYDLVLAEAGETAKEKNIRYRSFLITFFVFILLFLFVYFFAIPKIDPPLEESGGAMDVVLGNDAIGMNDNFTGVSAGATQPQQAYTPSAASQTQSMTDDIPEPDKDAPEVTKTVTVDKKLPVTEPVKKPADQRPDPATEPVKTKVAETPKPERKADPRALFQKGPTGNGGTGGTAYSKGTGNTPGDQGNPNGDPNSRSWKGNGKGDGNGDGTGPGTGLGSGPGYELTGRTKISIPPVQDNSQLSGRIVVEIQVNRAGFVVSVRGGIRGTTIDNDNLIKKCEQNARKARFSSKEDAQEVQYGKITYNFKLQ